MYNMKLMYYMQVATLICFVACAQKPEDERVDAPTIHIENFEEKRLDSNRLLSKVEVVKLGNDSVVVGEVIDVEKMDSLLYVLDNVGNILAIDLTHKEMVYHVQRVGNGSCEYLKATDLCCYYQHVYVMDAGARRVIKFDARLRPISEVRISPSSMTFAATDDSHLIFENLNREIIPFKFIRSSQSGNEQHPLQPCPKQQISYMLAPSQFRYAEGLLWYHESGSNQLLCWTDTTFTVAYQYDFGKKGYTGSGSIEPGDEDSYALNTSVWKLSGCIINSFLYKKHRYYGFYNCERHKVAVGTLKEYDGLPFDPRWATDELLIGCAGGLTDVRYGIEADDIVLLLFTLQK